MGDAPLSRASTESDSGSDSSPAKRMKWRNHENTRTPDPETMLGNPFDDIDHNGEHLPSYDMARPSSSKSKDLDTKDSRVEDGFNSGDDESSSKSQKKSKSNNSLPERTALNKDMIETGNENHGEGRNANRAREGDVAGEGMQQDAEEEREIDKRRAVGKEGKLGFRGRVRHFTWTWFTMTMATGGIANVLYTVPFRFQGLYAIGCIFFILNIVLFIFNITMISTRFYYYPKTFRASFLHPTESLFIPASVISFGTILINISQYGVDFTGVWLAKTMVVLYYIDLGLAVIFSVGIYLVMWSTQTFTISQMTPVWIFPAYPLLIIGPHAGNLAPKIADNISTFSALPIVISGFVVQGIGFLVSLMIYSAFLYRLMTQKLPKESLRPGMFISVGPSGFTIAGIVNMGQVLPKVVPKDFMGPGLGELAGNVSMICANWIGLWLWGLALWFFFVSVGAHWSCARKGKMDFAMTWYSFVFPNTALTTATFAVAKALGGNKPIEYVGCAMAIALVIAWMAVFVMMLKAVKGKQILWPQKQEDRDEGGWTGPKEEDFQKQMDGEHGVFKTLSRTLSRRSKRSVGKGTRRSDNTDGVSRRR